MIKKLIAFFIAVAFLSGCGYTTSALRSERMKNIYISTFLNRTYESGLDRLVTDRVADEFIFRGGVKVVEEKRADAEFGGVITDYALKPLSYNRENQAEEYRLRITVDIYLKDMGSGNIIWERKGLSGEWTFLFSGPLSITEEDARDKAIEYLAREAVQAALEMW